MIEEYYDDEEEQTEYAVRPNKTRIKQEIAEVAAIAEKICELSETHIASLELPDSIHGAVMDVAKMPAKSARKRLLKFITGQLRKIELAPIIDKLDRLSSQSAHATREHHQAERWRDQLLGEQGHEALTKLLAEFPHMDRQHLRQLQRNALKEIKAEKSPKSARLIYHYLKEYIAK